PAGGIAPSSAASNIGAAPAQEPDRPAVSSETTTVAPTAAPEGHEDGSKSASHAPLIRLQSGGRRVVHSQRGMVTSVEEHATRAGVAMLEKGGNAVDAAVAVAYALAVTHPSAGNLGGGGFMMIKL